MSKFTFRTAQMALGKRKKKTCLQKRVAKFRSQRSSNFWITKSKPSKQLELKLVLKVKANSCSLLFIGHTCFCSAFAPLFRPGTRGRYKQQNADRCSRAALCSLPSALSDVALQSLSFSSLLHNFPNGLIHSAFAFSD